MQWKRWKGDALCQALLCALGFGAVYFYAGGTTPLRPDAYLWDSALFQVVGKLWADGLVPYVDIFDHKGPLLFLVQKLAYETANPRAALYIIESLLVSVSLALGYQCLRLKYKPLLSFGGAALMGLFWIPLMEYGNLCETHSMPWLMLALYLQLRYFTSEKPKHPWPYAFLYGLCFGANLMIRPNNGILIAIVTLVITIGLMAMGEWKNIAHNALALIAGVAAAVVPFVGYFAAKGALDEFLYATWTFNLVYASSLEFLIDWQSLRNVLFFIVPSVLCLGLAALCCLKKRWAVAGALALSALGTLFVTLSGIGYAHYFMLHAPLIVLALYAMAGWEKPWRMAVLCALLVLCVGKMSIPYLQANLLHAPTAEEAAAEAAYDQMVSDICAQIPADEQDAVAVCGLLVTDAELFLKSELHPVGRYCFLMEWHSRADNSIRQRFMHTLRSGEARWLIYREGGAPDDLLSLMNEHFTLHSTHEWQETEYRVYRWK